MQAVSAIRRTLAHGAAGAVLAIAGVGLTACGGGDDPTVVGQPGRPDLGQIDAETGEDVTVTGEVTEALSPGVFTMATDESQDGDILVVGDEATAVSAGQVVEVSGTVTHIARGFAADTGLDPGQEGLYRQLGLDNEQDFIAAYEGSTSIAADRVEVVATD